MATDVRGHTVPAGSDAFDPQGSAVTLSLSTNDPVFATSATDRAAKLTAIGSSAARPLFVWQTDTGALWVHNGTVWREVGAGLRVINPTSVVNGTQVGGTVTFSGVTSVSLNGVFTSAFDNYQVLIALSSTTAAADIFMIMRAAGVDNTSLAYLSAYSQIASATPAAGFTSPAYGAIVGRSNGAGGGSMRLDVMGPALPQRTRITGSSVDDTIGRSIFSGLLDSSAYDGFTINGATMTGTIRVYGYNNG